MAVREDIKAKVLEQVGQLFVDVAECEEKEEGGVGCKYLRHRASYDNFKKKKVYYNSNNESFVRFIAILTFCT